MGPESADEAAQPTSAQAPPAGAAPALEPPLARVSEEQVDEIADAGSLSAAQPSPLGSDLNPNLPEVAIGAALADGPPALESAPSTRPSFVFFGIVAGLSLAADISTKVWAELTLNQRGFEPLELIKDHLSITLAYNRGGAWGLFATASDMVRKPFFLGVSVAAIAFIISLYARLTSRQKALRWGLPLVLGGALGNLNDRITRSQVIDFIDFRADWIMDLNVFVHRYVPSWAMTDHWPTFNVADVAICIGVGLMAVDMFTHRPRRVSLAPAGPLSVPPLPGLDDHVPGPGPEVRLEAGPEARPDAPPALG
jgi:signal peptidase II